MHARDYTHDPAGGFDSWEYACWIRDEVNAGRMHISYVISQRKIFNPDISTAWRDYTGSNPHEHHCHCSINYDARENDESPWGWAGAGEDIVTPDDIKAIAQAVWAYAGIPNKITGQKDAAWEVLSAAHAEAYNGSLQRPVDNLVKGENQPKTARAADVLAWTRADANKATK